MEIVTKLDSFNKCYNMNSNITGTISINNKEKFPTDFSQMYAILNGSYVIKNNKVSPPAISVIKFYTKKSIIAENGKINLGNNNTFHLKLTLTEDNDQKLFETYQGVLITINYELYVELVSLRGQYTSDHTKINIFVPGQGVKDDLKKKAIPYEFSINPGTLEKVKINQSKIPQFSIGCKIDNTNCDLNAPFDGTINIQESEIQIKSIELQYVRNEMIILPIGEVLTETSEIQNLQIGDGDVIRNVEIPLFMIFPRFFSCASLETKIVKISFEMNVIIVLVNGFVITENFPVNTWRS